MIELLPLTFTVRCHGNPGAFCFGANTICARTLVGSMAWLLKVAGSIIAIKDAGERSYPDCFVDLGK